jgi:hypothetical protein
LGYIDPCSPDFSTPFKDRRHAHRRTMHTRTRRSFLCFPYFRCMNLRKSTRVLYTTTTTPRASPNSLLSPMIKAGQSRVRGLQQPHPQAHAQQRGHRPALPCNLPPLPAARQLPGVQCLAVDLNCGSKCVCVCVYMHGCDLPGSGCGCASCDLRWKNGGRVGSHYVNMVYINAL